MIIEVKVLVFYNWNRLDEPVFMVGAKPLWGKYGIHHGLESCKHFPCSVFHRMHYLAQFTSQGPALRQEMLQDYRELNISSKISSWNTESPLREQVVNLQKILISDLLESCSRSGH